MKNPTLAYVWDPLCAWCYAFSPVIHKMMDRYSKEFNFEIITGGMATGNRVGPVSEKALYIKKKLPDLERISGIKFSEKYYRLLDEGTAINDSLPPSIAFHVLKSLRRDLAMEFAGEIQDALFQQGKDLNQIKVYLAVAENHEVNKHAFMEYYEDPGFKKMAENDFSLSRTWGVVKYPSLVLLTETDARIIHKGYADYESLEKTIIHVTDPGGAS